MEHPIQANINDFYLIHSFPTREFKRVKGVEVNEVRVADMGCSVIVSEANSKHLKIDVADPLSFYNPPEKLFGRKLDYSFVTTLTPGSFGKSRLCGIKVMQVVSRGDTKVVLASYSLSRDGNRFERLYWVRPGHAATIMLDKPLQASKSLDQDGKYVAVISLDRSVYLWKWINLLEGNVDPIIAYNSDITRAGASDFLFENNGISVLTVSGSIRIAGRSSLIQISHDEKGYEWSGIAKVDMYGYIVSGIDRATDPPIMVIKLLTKKLRPVSSVIFLDNYSFKVTIEKVLLVAIKTCVIVLAQPSMHFFKVRRGKLLQISSKSRILSHPIQSVTRLTKNNSILISTGSSKLVTIELSFK